MLRGLDWAIGWLERLARIWLVLMVVVVLAFTFGQVLDRYLVSTGFDGFDQLARLGLVWATFIGIALAFRDRRTIRIELFEERLPPWLKRARDLLFELLVLALLVLVHVKGWPVVAVGARQNILGTPFTLAMGYSALLVGTVLYGLFVLLRIARTLGLAVSDGAPPPGPDEAEGPAQ